MDFYGFLGRSYHTLLSNGWHTTRFSCLNAKKGPWSLETQSQLLLIADAISNPTRPNDDFGIFRDDWTLEYLGYVDEQISDHVWLVVSTPLKNISQFGMIIPNIGKNRSHVPNHQPEKNYGDKRYMAN